MAISFGSACNLLQWERISSHTSGFFLCGMMLEPVVSSSGKLMKPKFWFMNKQASIAILESVAAKLAGGVAVAITRAGPLNLTRPGISQIKGENIYARAGRRAHDALKERVKAKEADGWQYEPGIEGSTLKPDVGMPRRNLLEPESRNYLELKPNTPSGRQAAARQIRKYQDAFKDGQKVRGIFYDPKDFLKDLP